MNKEIIIKEVDEIVKKQLEEEKIVEGMFGYITVFEERKKRILKEKGIDWKTTHDKNPGICID